ncbi:hypothetical protein DOM21_02475 [Bacteriovorax stolpii]|uniref:Uncharacterized protein n=1 Tax=Bacteriovorax stolpii TaxID=960 RepID=A0A2K9NVY2_BACTC|nr:hypothetical protein [Bacteriovorax stolpii]AUN99666.1 hypothetical protein C0V70_16440 [Bacteriovorax stolpii]QDK40337.1 hypothetical protein DOM21_02475 [Bacteriovorax stolpii]TDP51298.1 hypothetical protein C8D79_3470 [Bacteriovorax stolpii]
MKSFILAIALAFSTASFANDSIEASNASELKILDLVIGVQQTYSVTSELQAKVVEILAGDGMNATRMILVLNTGYQDSKVFELDEMMYEVKRIVFLAKDVIVINYVQDSFDDAEAMNPIQVKKSITIKVLRNADGTLADKIEIVR